MPYMCPFEGCGGIAFETFAQLNAHWVAKHMDRREEWPSKEDAEIEELPEGVKLIKSRAKERRSLLTEERKPPAYEIEIGEFSEEAKKLHDLLVLHGEKKELAEEVANLYDKVDIYKEPFNLANYLFQKLGSKKRHIIYPIMYELYPQRRAELPYFVPSSAEPYSPPIFPQAPQPPHYYPQHYPYREPIYRYQNYPYREPYREPHEPEIEAESGRGRKGKKEEEISSEIDVKMRGFRSEIANRLSKMEEAMGKMFEEREEERKSREEEERSRREEERFKSAINEVTQRYEKQMGEQSKLLEGLLSEREAAKEKERKEKERENFLKPFLEEQRKVREEYQEDIKSLRDEYLTKFKESKPEDGEDWIKKYYEERGKRLDEVIERQNKIIEDLGARLEKTGKAGEEAYRKAKQEYMGERAKEEEIRDKVRSEMQETGWAPREKRLDERMMDITEQKIVPGALGEMKEIRKGVDRLAGKFTGAGGEAESEEREISEGEAGRYSQVMEIDEEMRKIASE